MRKNYILYMVMMVCASATVFCPGAGDKHKRNHRTEGER